MAHPDGVCKYDGVGAGGRHKGAKHPSDFGPGRGNQSGKTGGSTPAVKAGAAKGADAGGTDSLRGTKTQHLNATTGPSNPGKRKVWPGEVRVGDGVSVPHKVK